MRAWRFSSVMSGSRPSKRVGEQLVVDLHRRRDRDLEQLDAEVLGQRLARRRCVPDGGVARRHRHARARGRRPSASTAISATSVESIPPERPITTRPKPFFST